MVTPTQRFLLVRLHLESLSDKTTIKAVKQALDTLPKGSEALTFAYSDAIERIENQKTGFATLAKETLSWLVCVERELNIDELLHALAVEENAQGLDEENIQEAEDVISSCAGLVVLDEETQVIRLVHYTLQEYLESKLVSWAPQARELVAAACLTYLAFESCTPSRANFVEYGDETLFYDESQSRFVRHCQLHPFFRYAAKHWVTHARYCIGRTSHFRILDFLESMEESQRLDTLLQIMMYNVPFPLPHEQATRLHVLAMIGFEAQCAEIIRKGYSPIVQDFHGQTPMHYATFPYPGASDGQEDVIKLLLAKSEVDPNTQDAHGVTPLICAVQCGRDDITQVLLTYPDIDVNMVTAGYFFTALFYAVTGCHELITRALLQRDDLDVNFQNKTGMTALMHAASRGRTSVVEIILQHSGVRIDLRNDRNETALMIAYRKGYRAIVRLLENIGAPGEIPEASERNYRYAPAQIPEKM